LTLSPRFQRGQDRGLTAGAGGGFLLAALGRRDYNFMETARREGRTEVSGTDELGLMATTTAGLEACVKRELGDLGFADAKVRSPGRIGFGADAAGLARANLWLRTADRVLLVVGTFEARDFGELFDRTAALPWERWIGPEGRFPVLGRSHKSQLSSVPACQKIVKKAIVERLRAAHGVVELPETGATSTVEVALRDDTATLTIDTTGPGLHKRGYRAAAGPAPLKETLAAALIQLSFWRPDRPLHDPFCGSGTIPIEAALIGRNIAPGLRRRFAAEAWPAIPEHHWAAERQRAREAVRPAPEMRIVGTDIEPKAISLSAYHAELAGVAGDVHFQCDPFDRLAPSRPYGCVICNPPYGRRVRNSPDVTALYQSMREVFGGMKTWSFYVLTSVELEAILGRPADRRRKLYNGQIECTYYQFHGPRPPKASPGAAESPADPPHDKPEAPPHDDPAAMPQAPAFVRPSDRAAAQAELFANRLRKRARHLRRWPGRGITCYRLYDRDIPEVPLAVDVYEGRLHIAEYVRPHDRTTAEHADWLGLMAKTAAEVTDVAPERVYLKRRRRQKGAAQYGKVARAAAVCTVGEGGLTFEVNLSDYLDTGLFLDHRITRGKVRDESAGKRMLNLFGYTGAFSVYAADGGAASTTTVDASKTYLDWALRNLTANGFGPPRHRGVRSDAMAFLRGHAPGAHYDLAVVDPPTFSNTKGIEEVFDVQRDHAGLLAATAELMSPGGVIYFSTNFRRFKFDGGASGHLTAREITRQTIPDDFRNKRIHRCWRIVVTPAE